LGCSNLQTTATTGLLHELETVGRPLSFVEGERVMVEGEHGKGIYILRSGSARVSMTSHDGKVIALRELHPGSYIGVSSALSCDHSCYTVEVTGAAEFIFVPTGEAQELLRSRPDLCLQVIELLGREMSSLCKERALLNVEATPAHIQT
jgi:CRP-like cAMP-binding protein